MAEVYEGSVFPLARSKVVLYMGGGVEELVPVWDSFDGKFDIRKPKGPIFKFGLSGPFHAASKAKQEPNYVAGFFIGDHRRASYGSTS